MLVLAHDTARQEAQDEHYRALEAPVQVGDVPVEVGSRAARSRRGRAALPRGRPRVARVVLVADHHAGGVPAPGAQRGEDAAGRRGGDPRGARVDRPGPWAGAAVRRPQRLLRRAPAAARDGPRRHAPRGDGADRRDRRRRAPVARPPRPARRRLQREHARRGGAPGGVPAAAGPERGMRIPRDAAAGGVLLGHGRPAGDRHGLAARQRAEAVPDDPRPLPARRRGAGGPLLLLVRGHRAAEGARRRSGLPPAPAPLGGLPPGSPARPRRPPGHVEVARGSGCRAAASRARSSSGSRRR